MFPPTRFDNEPVETHGEAIIAKAALTYVPGVTPVEAGQLIATVGLSGSAAATYAAHHAILEDLRFTKEVFTNADELGKPEYKNALSRALIFSGLVAYGRCYRSGVRDRLSIEAVTSAIPGFDTTVHEYLLSVRDKHVAHSVNEYEKYTPVAAVRIAPDNTISDGYAIGVVLNLEIGVSRRVLLAAMEMIDGIVAYLEQRLAAEGVSLHQNFAARLAQGETFEIVPLMTPSNRVNVGKRRP